MKYRSSIRAKVAAAAVSVLALGSTVLFQTPASAFGASTPANVVNYLKQISGNHIISGVHNKEPLSNPTQYTNQIHDITGKYTGLWGGELGFTSSDIANRQTMINQAKTEWANGSLVALTWHMCKPNVATCAFEGGVKGTSLSDADWNQLITNGTALNTAYKNKLETAVQYLQQLKDAQIPVLFRPLHEMSEGWAWWGGRAGANGSARLFQITHDYLLSRGLTNLIWVWNVKDNGSSSSVPSFYPGDNYVDVASLDPWVHGFPQQDWYQAMVNVAHGKPIALAEVGNTPTASALAGQPLWTYFMIWSEYISTCNCNSTIQNTINNARTLNQGGFTIPSGGQPPTTPPTTPPTGSHTGTITGVGGKCIDVAGSSTANGTAVQLYDCNGSTAQQWTIGTDNTIRALGKCLDVTGQGTANGTTIQLWDCNGSGAQQWTPQANGHLRNPQSGRDLDVPGGTTTNGTRLQIWDTNTNPWQTWQLPA